MHVNLLPPRFVWRQLFRKRLRQWSCAYGVVAIAFIGGNARLLSQWWIDQREYQAMHTAAEPVRELTESRIALAKDVFSRRQRLHYLQSLGSHDRTVSLLGMIASSVKATGETLQIQELQVSTDLAGVEPQPVQSATNSTVVPSAVKPQNQFHLAIKGISSKSESISGFIESLQEFKVFAAVDLKSTQERIVMERSVQDFQLECHGNDN